MRRNELPDTCLSTLPSTGQLVVLKHGVRGYYRSEWDTGNRAENRDIADSHNRRRGITDTHLPSAVRPSCSATPPLPTRSLFCRSRRGKKSCAITFCASRSA